LREIVERVPIRPRCNKVCTRSANVGSAPAGCVLAAPEPACFPVGNEDICNSPPSCSAHLPAGKRVVPILLGMFPEPKATFTTDFGEHAVPPPKKWSSRPLCRLCPSNTISGSAPVLASPESLLEIILSESDFPFQLKGRMSTTRLLTASDKQGGLNGSTGRELEVYLQVSQKLELLAIDASNGNIT
jgi:hypothetical protein